MTCTRVSTTGQRIGAATLALALLAGCSSAPRNFRPRLAQEPIDAAGFQRVHDSCKQQVAQGQRENFAADRGTSGGVGVAVGAGLTAATVSSAGTSMVAAAAVSTAVVASMLILAPLAMFATSRYIRSGKEGEIKQAMGRCLSASGYAVSDWELTPAD